MMKMKSKKIRINNGIFIVICLFFSLFALTTGCNPVKKIVNEYNNRYTFLFNSCDNNPNIAGICIAIGYTSLQIGMVSQHEEDSINTVYNNTNVENFTVVFKDSTERELNVVTANDSLYVAFREEIPYIVFLSEIATNRGKDDLTLFLKEKHPDYISEQDSAQTLHWEAIGRYRFSPLTYRLIVIPAENRKNAMRTDF